MKNLAKEDFEVGGGKQVMLITTICHAVFEE